MAEDPRRVMIEVFARLGRETQLHLDERHRHFKITDAVIIAISALLTIVAVFNVYYVHILYQDLSGIVSSMDSMHDNMQQVKGSMTSITENIGNFNEHMAHMDSNFPQCRKQYVFDKRFDPVDRNRYGLAQRRND